MVNQFTEEQVNDIFGEVELEFKSYYKYSFSFTGTKNIFIISTSFGGNADDIYRYDVSTEHKKFGKIRDWSSVVIVEKGIVEKRVFEWFDD